MKTRPISIVVAGLLLAAGDMRATPQQPVQSISDVVRTLAGQHSILQMPSIGRVKAKWGKGAPTYALPTGSSTALLLQLSDYKAPYLLTISSARRGLGRTTEIFIPSAAVLDADFQLLVEIAEQRFAGRIETLVGEVRIDDALSRARYVLLYTRGELVGQQVMLGGQDVLDDAIGSLFQKGLFRVERSLDASLEIDTRMLPGYAGLVTRTPTEIVAGLLQTSAAVTVPATGRIKHVIANRPPTYSLAGGPSSVVLFRLPEYQNPYVLVVKSSKQRSSVFVPSGFLFDADFRPVDEFGEDRLIGNEAIEVELGFAESTRNARYLLLYTRGNLVGMTVRLGSIKSISGHLHWLTRSLEGALELESRSPK